MKTALYRRTLLVSAVALGISGVAQNAAAVNIDLFDTGDFGPVVLGPSPPFESSPYGPVPTAGGLGGTRLISATRTSLINEVSSVSIGGGNYNHSQAVNVEATSRVVWNSNGSGFFPSVDFTDGLTSNAIRVHVAVSDLFEAGNTIGVTLSDSGGSATQEFDISNSPQPAPFYIDFLFSGFSGIDPEAITAVQFDVNGATGANWDLAINSIATACSGNTQTPVGSLQPNNGVCEPPPPPEQPEIVHPKTVPAMTPLGLLGLGAGLVGIAGFFARRRKK